MAKADNQDKLYRYDLFIGYFSGQNGTEDAARELYDQLNVAYPNLEVFFFPVSGKASTYVRTHLNDGIIPSGCKSALFVVSDKLERYKAPGKEGFIRMRNEKGQKDENGLYPEREVLKEILSCRKNEFFRKVINDRGEEPVRLVYAKGSGTFNIESVFDPDDVGKFDKDESHVSDWDAYNPLDGCPTIHLSDDNAIKEIGRFVKDIRSHYNPALKLNENLYWVGTRSSDFDGCDDINFAGSVCLFGKSHDRHYSYSDEVNRIDHNAPNVDADLWVYRKVKAIKESDPSARFYCYNPIIPYATFDRDGKNPYKEKDENGVCLLDSFICLNSEEVLLELANKAKFRDLCSDAPADESGRGVHLIPSVKATPSQINFNDLDLLLNQEQKPIKRYVVQAPVSSGGVSTFLIDNREDTAREVYYRLPPNVPEFICSPYIEHNIPVNAHVFIEKSDAETEEERREKRPRIFISAPSIQLSKECDSRIIYRGADFIEARNLPSELLNEFLRQVRLAAEELYRRGFFGICGIDGIICDAFYMDKNRVPFTEEEAYERVYLLEVNARFQASSALLNRGLKGARFHSLQYLNFLACSENGLSSLSEFQLGLFKAPKGDDKAVVPNEWGDGTVFSRLNVPYSNFNYMKTRSNRQAMHILSLMEDQETRQDCFIVDYELDGLDPKLSASDLDRLGKLDGSPDAEHALYFEKECHLYRIVFGTNLCWVNTESTLNFHESLLEENEQVYFYLNARHIEGREQRMRMLYLKVALLIQGIRFGEGVNAMRPGTFQAVDIIFKSKEKYGGYVVNAPITRPFNPDEGVKVKKDIRNLGNVKFTGLTPFELRANGKGAISLYYFNTYIDDIFFFPKDPLQDKKTSKGIRYDSIAYLSTDRLRVHTTNKCKFKRHGVGCRFCGIMPDGNDDCVTFERINQEEVLNDYIDHYVLNATKVDDPAYADTGIMPLRHFLIGGQTADLDESFSRKLMIDTVSLVRGLAGRFAEIYAMIVPCSLPTISAMASKGLTQLAFNMEVYDQRLAKIFMPGKRDDKHDTELYLSSLKAAHLVLNGHEKVRSMLLIGLEPIASTLKGIQALVDLDIQPMLSIFRPMPGTDLADAMPPSIEEVVAVYERGTRICMRKRYDDPKRHMHLGPDCMPCQNNTVALPYEHGHKLGRICKSGEEPTEEAIKTTYLGIKPRK